MTLSSLSVVTSPGGLRTITARLDDGYVIARQFHTGVLTRDADWQAAFTKLMSEAVAYIGAKVPPPLPSDHTVGGPA